MKSPRLPGVLACVPLALALAACGVARPPPAATAAIPAQWNTPLPASALPHGGSLAALAGWWRRHDDPLLVELIEAAQAASPTVASAAARIAEARSARVAAGAALAPRLDGALSASRGPTTAAGGFAGAGLGTGGSAAAGGTPAASTLAETPPLTTLQAGLQASWELDLFGGLRASRDAAQARASAADARWHDARVSVAADTANAYFNERACRRQLAVAESDTRSRAETARLSELSARAGFTAPADAALAHAGASDASARLTQQRTQCAALRAGLVALTGLDAGILEQKLAAAPVDRGPTAIESIASVPAEALAQRPDVYAAEQAVAAASADAGAAQAQRYPRLALAGSIAALQIRVGGFRESLQTWSVGPVSLSVPIFDGGTRAANAEAARARYDEAVALYRAGVRQAVREVEEALLQLQGTAARAADADAAVRGYQASFDATQARYASGLASLFVLEDARRTLFAAQTARVALERERAQAWVALYRAMGGGWSRPEGSIASSGPDGAGDPRNAGNGTATPRPRTDHSPESPVSSPGTARPAPSLTASTSP